MISVSSMKDVAAFFDRYAYGNLLELHGAKRLLKRQLALIRKFARPQRASTQGSRRRGYGLLEGFQKAFQLAALLAFGTAGLLVVSSRKIGDS